MSNRNILAISVDIREVGKKIKSSKKRFTWFFSIDGQKHTLDLFLSVLSRKRKLLLNNSVILEDKKSELSHNFMIDGVSMNLQPKGDSFELTFNKISFSELYTQAKTKQEFQEDDGRYDSYDNSTKPKQLQSRYQGISSSTYQSQQVENKRKPQLDSDEDEEVYQENTFNKYSNKNNNNYQHKVEQPPKPKKEEDPYNFDTGFGQFEWKGQQNAQQQSRSQVSAPAQKVNSVQKPKEPTDFSQYSFKPNVVISQGQQAPSSQSQSTFDGFGQNNSSNAKANSDPFSNFFGSNPFGNPQPSKPPTQPTQQNNNANPVRQAAQPPVVVQPPVVHNVLDLLDDGEDDVPQPPVPQQQQQQSAQQQLTNQFNMMTLNQPVSQTQPPVQTTNLMDMYEASKPVSQPIQNQPEQQPQSQSRNPNYGALYSMAPQQMPYQNAQQQHPGMMYQQQQNYGQQPFVQQQGQNAQMYQQQQYMGQQQQQQQQQNFPYQMQPQQQAQQYPYQTSFQAGNMNNGFNTGNGNGFNNGNGFFEAPKAVNTNTNSNPFDDLF